MSIFAVKKTIEAEHGIFSCVHDNKIRVQCFGFNFITFGARYTEVTPMGKLFKCAVFASGSYAAFLMSPGVANFSRVLLIGACGYSLMKAFQLMDNARLLKSLSKEYPGKLELTICGLYCSYKTNFKPVVNIF